MDEIPFTGFRPKLASKSFKHTNTGTKQLEFKLEPYKKTPK